MNKPPDGKIRRVKFCASPIAVLSENPAVGRLACGDSMLATFSKTNTWLRLATTSPRIWSLEHVDVENCGQTRVYLTSALFLTNDSVSDTLSRKAVSMKQHDAFGLVESRKQESLPGRA